MATMAKEAWHLPQQPLLTIATGTSASTASHRSRQSGGEEPGHPAATPSGPRGRGGSRAAVRGADGRGRDGAGEEGIARVSSQLCHTSFSLKVEGQNNPPLLLLDLQVAGHRCEHTACSSI